MTQPIRVIFFGTPQFSVPTLQTLLNDSRFEVLGVVSQPDRPSGRGQKLLPTPIKQCGEAVGLKVLQPTRLRKDQEVLTWLKEQAPDYFVTIAFGQILSQEVLDIPKKGTVNVHASLLPELRGANPIQQAILQGKRETGITTMLTDIGVDTGDMLLKTVLPIGENETTGQLMTRMAEAGGPLLVETLARHFAGELTPRPQAHEKATHAPKAEKTDAAINWESPADLIHRQIRSYNPAPGAYCSFEGQRIKLLEASAYHAPEHAKEILKNDRPGQICLMIKEGLVVAAGDGNYLLIQRLQPAGKKDMPSADWARNALKEVITVQDGLSVIHDKRFEAALEVSV
ncbi:MAG: methionyl-tRNA formyltransferase [Vampirovibrionales bacterium]|nr:methionyl-tRNA formyltransferase [Vampirovibrionales bacterium]